MLTDLISRRRQQSQFSDLVGVDFAATATKVVRLKKSKGALLLTGLELLPPVDLKSDHGPLELSRNMTAKYGCLAYTGTRAIVRMINTSAPEGKLSDEQIRKLLNVSEEYRVSASLVNTAAGGREASFLAAAIPEEDAANMLAQFPAGPPAPASLEVAGLSFITAFLQARGQELADTTVCLLECGEQISNFAFIAKGKPVLVGKLPLGAKLMKEKIAADVGLDEELAASILSDASVNISASVANVLGPPIKQLSISKDFIERHLGKRISSVYLSGGMSLMGGWTEQLSRMLGVKVESWNPLENIQYDTAAVPAELVGQITRFTAAVGAALGGME